MPVNKNTLNRLILDGLDPLINEKQERELGIAEIERRIEDASAVCPLPLTLWTRIAPDTDAIPTLLQLLNAREKLLLSAEEFKNAVDVAYSELFGALVGNIPKLEASIKEMAKANISLSAIVLLACSNIYLRMADMPTKSVMVSNMVIAAAIILVYKIIDTYELHSKSDTQR